MLRKLSIFFAFLLATVALAGATDRITIAVTTTNNPTHGLTLVINSDTRTWSTNATGDAQISITNTVAGNFTNLYNHISDHGFSGPISLVWSTNNTVKLVGASGQAMSGTASNLWGYLTFTTNAVVAADAVRVPFSAEPTASKSTNTASQIVAGINAYATNQFDTGVIPLIPLATGSDLDGTSMTNLNAAQLLFGTIPTLRYGAEVLQTNSNLNASNLASGTIPAGRYGNGTIPLVALSTNSGTNAQTIKIVAGVPTWADETGAGGGEANTASTSGSGLPITLAKAGVDLPFRGFTSGTGLSATTNADTLTYSLVWDILNASNDLRYVTLTTYADCTNRVSKLENGAITNAVNSGTTSLIKEITAGVLKLIGLKAGANITLTDEGGTNLVIASTGGSSSSDGVLTNDLNYLSTAIPNFGSVVKLSAGVETNTVSPTVSAGACALIKSLRLHNTAAAGGIFSIWVWSGTANDPTNYLARDYTIGMRSTVSYEDVALNSGGFVNVQGSNGLNTVASYSLQQTNTWTGCGKTWGVTTNALIATDPVAASTKVRIKNLYVLNTNTAGTAFTILHIDAANQTNFVAKDYTLGARSLWQLKDLYLNTGDAFRGFGTNCMSVTTEEVR